MAHAVCEIFHWLCAFQDCFPVFSNKSLDICASESQVLLPPKYDALCMCAFSCLDTISSCGYGPEAQRSNGTLLVHVAEEVIERLVVFFPPQQ